MSINRSLARTAAVAVAALAIALTAPVALAGTLNVVDTEQYNGTYGLDIGITDTTPTYVETDSPQSETRFRARFYVKSTLLTLGSGESLVVMSAVGGGNDQVRVIVEESGGAKYLFFEVRTDAGSYTKTATGVELPDGWRAIEFDWQASDGSDNGALDFWMDGWSAAELSATGLSGLDNNDQTIDYARMGAVSGIQAGTSGNVFFDDFEAHRDTGIGLLSLFSDVPTSHWAWDFAHSAYAVGIMDMCAPGTFCLDDDVTRGTMALYIVRGMYGEYYVPPAATGIFADVPAGDPLAPYIEQIYNDGITSGCGGGNYCPDTVVTRDQIAVFNLRAQFGSAYDPDPPCGCVFDDVTDTGLWSTEWIEALYNEGLTAGCSTTPLLYCPNGSVSRGQMSTFLVKMYNIAKVKRQD